MASVPRCGLCRVTQILEEKTKNYKKTFLIYSVFFVLLFELFSTIINYIYIPNKTGYDFYSDFVYILLTQLCLFLFSTSLFLWRERLHFCLRKATATLFLSLYYLFGFLAVLFCFSANLYFQFVNTTLIILSVILFVQSLYVKNYVD